MRALWSLVLVVSPAIASPLPVAPAAPADLSLDYSALVLQQVRGPAPRDPKLALCGYDRTECEQACAAGSQLSCTRLGVVLMRENDPTSAKKVLATACGKKVWSACIHLANLDAEAAAPRLVAGCKAGHTRSCATLVERTMGDPDAVQRYLALGCKGGDWEACNTLAHESRDHALQIKHVKQAFAGSRKGSPITCPRSAKPLRGVDRERGRAGRPTWVCAMNTGYGRIILPYGPYLIYASEEDARVGGIVAKRGERGERGPARILEQFDERGRLLLFRHESRTGAARTGSLFGLDYNDTTLLSVTRIDLVDGRATSGRQLHLTPIQMIDVFDVDPSGEKAGTWIRVRHGRVVGKAAYLDDMHQGDAFEWDDNGAFISQTTYERGVPIRRRIPKGNVLVDDPAFKKP